MTGALVLVVIAMFAILVLHGDPGAPKPPAPPAPPPPPTIAELEAADRAWIAELTAANEALRKERRAKLGLPN